MPLHEKDPNGIKLFAEAFCGAIFGTLVIF